MEFGGEEAQALEKAFGGWAVVTALPPNDADGALGLMIGERAIDPALVVIRAARHVG